MKNKKITILLLIINIIITQIILSQKTKSVEGFEFVKNFTNIKKLHQDKKGYFWIFTNKELIRYDGYIFKNYHLKPDLINIPAAEISDMAEDENGEFFITSNNFGLYKFNSDSGKSILYNTSNSKKNTIPSNFLTCIHIDNKNMIWIGTMDSGLMKFDIRKNKFEKFTNHTDKKKPFSPNTVTAICQSSENELWVGFESGNLHSFNILKESFTKYAPGLTTGKGNIFNNIISCLYVDKDQIWIGTIMNGLKKFDLKSKKTDNFNFKVKTNAITFIKKDLSDNIIIGTFGKGLYLANHKEKKLDKIDIDLKKKEFISIRHLTNYLTDHVGNIWLGVFPGILLKKKAQTGKFNNYILRSPSKKSIRIPVLSIIEDANKQLWIGTESEGLIKFDRETEISNQFKFNPNDKKGISSNKISTIYQDETESIYIGTIQGGLNILNPGNKVFKQYRYDPDDTNSISSDNITCFLKDSKKRLWIGTLGRGLNQFNLERETFSRIMNKNGKPYLLPSNNIRCIYEDHSNNLWVGFPNGVCLYNEEQKAFIPLLYKKQNGNQEFKKSVRVISGDKKGNLWIGTYRGLYKYNFLSKILTKYTVKDGLINNTISGIIEDEIGHIWIGTINGLSKYDPGNNTFINFSTLDGLSSDYFLSSFINSKNGELILSTTNGIIGFFPDEIKLEMIPQKIIISDVQQLSKKNKNFIYKPGKKLLICDYKDTFNISFSTLSFMKPGKIKYSYMIKGLNSEWISIKNKNEVILSNLRSGKYSLFVKASYSGVLWTKKPAKLEIIVVPPFWETLWFKLLILMLIIIALSFWYKIRIEKVTSRIKTEMQFNSFCSEKKLTNREKEVLILALQRKTNKEIEDILYLSMGTIKVYTHNIYRKLNVKNRIELIKLFENMRHEVNL